MKKDRENGHLPEKEPARQHQQEEGPLQVGKKDLDKEPLGQRVPCVARRVAKHHPSGEDDKEGHYQHGPTEMRLIPFIKRLGYISHVLSLFHSKTKFMVIKAISEGFKVRQQQMEDDRIGHRENEQHLHRRETHLTPATDVVADEITGTQQQLPNAIQDRT